MSGLLASSIDHRLLLWKVAVPLGFEVGVSLVPANARSSSARRATSLKVP
jgi:hypothetical protein